ncbi:MAG TPA: chitobiase/beta-hexosaminidase C-terminal domain-containing protein [Opitutaceae bacterium]|nr:chitobiase/beta-hexosaminidase C-terminal domain-containing protein [Opitutaceae bacterium]
MLLLALASRLSAQTTLNFEAESLTYAASGATASVQTDTNSSGGKWVELAGNSVGDSITFTLPSVAAGTYQLQMKWKGNNSRGILQLSVDGANLGSTLDQYASGQTYPTTTFGNVTFSSAGAHTIKLTVTGKNGSSSNYQLSADKFTLVGQAASAVADPAFSPGGGTYGPAQNVTITSSTAGALIRYTTDGSTPTETLGTVYSGPVNISSTATLKAIAYESGFADSAVTTATYQIGSPPATFTLEAENLSPVGTGATVSTSNDANASGGVIEFLNATAAGQTITFTTPVIAAGPYQLQMRYKSNTTRGQHTVKIDGVQVGGTVDQYAKTSVYTTVTLGSATLNTSGTHTIVLTVTGKNSAATQFYLTADTFTFTGQSGPTQVAAPIFSPGAGVYSTAQNITISTATAGASIRYTTDGSTPTETLGTLYTGAPVVISSTTTINAIAYEAGFIDSNVASATYTVSSSNIISLFDGTDLNGWTQVPASSWTVNTTDVAIASLGKGRGFIYANNKYQFYRLRFEVRHLGVTAGGSDHKACMVFFGTSPSLDAMGGIQFQFPNGGDWDYRPGVNKGGGPHFTVFSHPTLDGSQWTSIELLVDGRNGTARIAEAQPVGSKATEIMDFSDPTEAISGYFAFQMHNSGLLDEYRNVTIEVNPAVDDLITTK